MRAQAKRPEAIPLALFPSIALGLVNGLYADELATAHAAWYWIADVVQFIAIPALAAFLLYRWAGYGPADYGFHRFVRHENVLRIAGLLVFVTVVYWLAYNPVLSFAHGVFWSTASSVAFIFVLPDAAALKALVLLYASSSAALVEEPVFRSLPWLYFSSRLRSPAVPYVLSTTVLFAAIHWEHGLPNQIAAATVGLASAVLYMRIRNVWPFVFAHFMTNLWAFRSF